MRFLALSDIHGERTKLQSIFIEAPKYDAILVGGDITTHGTPDDSEQIIELISKQCETVYAVAGNMDSGEIDTWLTKRGYGISGRGVRIGDIGIIGVAAAPHSILRTPYEVAEETIEDVLKNSWESISDARWKIILSHAPPYGTSVDKIRMGLHVGSKSLRSFIETYKPHLVVCGHIHESRGKDLLRNTIVVNCGSVAEGKYAVIAVDDNIEVELYG